MISKRTSLFIAFLISTKLLISQANQPSDNSISVLKGTVADSLTNELLYGVTIIINNTKSGTVTNSQGEFELLLKQATYTLKCNYIGYKSKEVTIELNKDISINIPLSSDIIILNEVKITSQRKFFGNMEYGREIPTIDADIIQKQNTNNASDILHARVSGVWATKTSGAPGDHEKIRIRGQSSFFSSAEPLYVVDGVPVPIVNLSSLGIADLNMHDIENITILKDASSTALYGFQGGNGVVLVDTKKGGVSETNFSLKFGYQWFNNYYDLMSTKDQIIALDSAFNLQISGLKTIYPIYSDTLCDHNRQKEIFSFGSTQEYQLSKAGTIKQTRYYLSSNYTNQKGILPGSKYSRYTFASHIGRQLWNRVATEMIYRGSFQENKNNQDEYKGNRLLYEGINKSPCFECTPDSMLYDNMGRENIRILYEYNPINRFETPKDIIRDNFNDLEIVTNTVSGFVKIKINDYLNINVMESFMARKTDYNTRFSYDLFSSVKSSAYYSTSLRSNEDVILFNHQVNMSYYRTFGKHDISVVLANRYYKDNLWWHVDSLEGQIPEHYSLKNSMAAYGTKGSVLRKMSSYVGNLSYNYNKTYFVSLVGNLSHIKEGLYTDYYSFFPSIALSCDIAQWYLLRDVKWIRNANIYVNRGISGNFPLNGLSNDLYEKMPYSFNGSPSYHPTVSILANHHLKHENTRETDYGLKLNLFNGRLILNTSYYVKTIEDLLIKRSIPYFYGGGMQYYNLGEVGVKGIDFGLELVPIQNHDFSWFSAINYSNSDQKVNKLGGEKISFTDIDILMPEFVIKENESLGNIYGYQYLGKMNESDWKDKSRYFVQANGSKFLNADSSDKDLTDADKIVIGKSIPDFTWSFSNSFRYKNLKVDLTWYGVYGIQKYNATRAATIMAVTNREVNDYIFDTLKVLRKNYFYESSIFIEDASFIRLKNLTFSYEPSEKLLNKVAISYSISFENLITITKYKGYDPEATIFTDNNFSDNSIDRGAVPNPKAVFFSVNLKF